MKLVLCDWDGNRGGAGVEEEGIGCHRLYLCSPPAHSVVSLSILLSLCPFCCLPVHPVISVSTLLSPCSFFCLTEKQPTREVEFARKLSIFRRWSSQASYFTVDITDAYSTRYVGYVPQVSGLETIIGQMCNGASCKLLLK